MKPNFRLKRLSNKQIALCADFLALFGYRILVMFPFYISNFKPNIFRKSFLVMALNMYGKKCFLLVQRLKSNNWIMQDLSSTYVYSRQYKSMQAMTEFYANYFLKRAYKQGHIIALPGLFLDYEINKNTPHDHDFPDQLKIFKSAKQN